MTSESSDKQSDTITKVSEIKIGHLFDVTLEFLEKFFTEAIREKRKDPRQFLVPADIHKSFDWSQLALPLSNIQSVQPAIPYYSGPISEETIKPRAHSSHFIGNPRPTKPGAALIVDKIKTGTRVVYYRVWINGEDRYFTETQLKYVLKIA